MTAKQQRAALIDAAITRIAALYEYGELKASTTPAELLNDVADELIANRKRITDTADRADELAQAYDEATGPHMELLRGAELYSTVAATLHEWRQRIVELELERDQARADAVQFAQEGWISFGTPRELTSTERGMMNERIARYASEDKP